MNITDLPEDFSVQLWMEFLKSIETSKRTNAVIFLITMVSIFVVGVIGNLLTCIVIYCDRSMHTATNYYLFNLALSDLMLAFGILLEMHIYFDGEFQFESYNVGNIVCKVHYILVIALWNNSILIMTVLAIERYIAICHPLLKKSMPVWRRVMKIIALIWTVVILEALPEAWTISLVYTKSSAVCFTVPTSFARIVNGVLAVVTFIVPLAIMLFVYTMIAIKVNLSQRNNSKDKIFNHRDYTKKVNKLIVALTLSFLVCWLPFFITRLVIFTCDSHQLVWLAQWWDLWLQIISVNGWFSIVLNPMLFSLMSTKFRKSLKALWDSKIMRRETTTHFTTSRIWV